MNLDLFGEPIKYEETIQVQYLRNLDELTLGNRIHRLQYLHKLNTDGFSFAGSDMEFTFCFREMQEAYINGHFLSTIVLGQAWIEKMLHTIFYEKNLNNIGKKGLAEMLKYSKENALVHDYILTKLDKFRQIRNPITHLKNLDYEYNLNNRSFQNKINPLVQLELDATEIIEICNHIALVGWK